MINTYKAKTKNTLERIKAPFMFTVQRFHLAWQINYQLTGDKTIADQLNKSFSSKGKNLASAVLKATRASSFFYQIPSQSNLF